jgi:hypothetical protein
MSEESLHDDAPKATKALFGTIAVILVMVGIEQLADRDGPRYLPGIPLIVAGIICFYAAVAWTAVRNRLPDRAKEEIANIALSPRWWIAAVMIGLIALTVQPYVEQQRWPFSASLSPPKRLVADGQIAWSFDQPGGSQFLLMTKINDGPVRIIGFTAHGRNQSSEPITDFSGVVRSDLTNEEMPLLLIAQPDPAERQPELPPNVTAPVPTPPKDTYGIPGFAEFDVSTYKKGSVSDTDGIVANDFLRHFGPFMVILNYGGSTHRHHFDEEQIEALITLLEKQAAGQNTTILLHVTRRPGANAVPIR